MDKEISEESHITEKLIRKYIKLNFNIDIEIPQDIKHIVLIASGSSYHCAAMVSDFINSKIHSFSDVYYSSEVCLNKDYKISDNTLYIFISQFLSFIIVYNKLTKQNSETIDHWTYEISQFFNEINNNRFSTKDKIKLLETVFTDFSRNSKVINAFLKKKKKEAKSNKRFNLINKTKEVVAMVVFEHFDVIFTTIKNCITNNEPLILDKNYISDFIKICNLNL